MKIGYFVLAILYIILALSDIKVGKLDFWVYVAIALVYAGISGVVNLGVQLD